MPWSNGLGTTEQIDIFPGTANVSERNFLWRLSSATVRASNPFSQFENFDRILIVTEGEGLLLNQTLLKPLEIFKFSGALRIDAKVIGSAVTDLGLIYDPRSVEATAQVCSWPAHPGDAAQNLVWPLGEGVHYFYVLAGTFQSEAGVVDTSSTLKIYDETELRVMAVSKPFCRLIHLHLRRKKI